MEMQKLLKPKKNQNQFSRIEIRCSKNETRNGNTKFSKTKNRLSKLEPEIDIQHFLKPQMNFRNPIWKNEIRKRNTEFKFSETKVQ